jgi:hypothetical protein
MDQPPNGNNPGGNDGFRGKNLDNGVTASSSTVTGDVQDQDVFGLDFGGTAFVAVMVVLGLLSGALLALTSPLPARVMTIFLCHLPTRVFLFLSHTSCLACPACLLPKRQAALHPTVLVSSLSLSMTRQVKHRQH